MIHLLRGVYNNLTSRSLTDAVEVTVGRVLTMAALSSEETSRKSIDDTIEDMDENDPIINAALSISAETATMFPESEKPTAFEIRSESQRVTKILEDMCNRTGLRNMAYDLIRTMLKFGNHFAEIVYDSDGRIMRIKQFPMPYWIRRNEDEYGRLKSGSTSVKIGPGVAAFDEFQDGVKYVASFDANQILHLIHGNTQGRPYASARLRSAITTWKTYRAVRDSLALKSVIGGTFTRIHKIPMPWGYDDKQKRGEIRKYMKAYGTRTVVTPGSSSSDLDITREPKIPLDVYIPTQIRADGNAIGPEMEIIKYPEYDNDFERLNVWINMIITCLRVPPNYIFWSMGDTSTQRALNIDKLDQQFVKAVRRLQEDFKRAIRKLFDLELIAHGILPNGKYEIVMPDIYPHTLRDMSKTRFNQAQAISMGIDAGMDPEWWTSFVLSVDTSEIKLNKTPDTGRNDQNKKAAPGDAGRPPNEEEQ